jgi:hypothetical protein
MSTSHPLLLLLHSPPLQVTRNKSTFKARIPFTAPATDRKTLKDVLVDMTKTARSALGMAGGQQ